MLSGDGSQWLPSSLSSSLHLIYLPERPSGALIFVAATQGTPLDHLALVASKAYVHGLYRNVTNEGRVLDQLPPQGTAERQQTEAASLSVKEEF